MNENRPDDLEVASNVLTIIIVSYRCADLLRQCLDALTPIATRPDIHVVVVDNCSSDGTVDLLRSAYPDVTTLEMRANAGFAAATNRGLATRVGGHVLLLNPDCIAHGDAILHCVAELERRPHVGILGCRLIRADGTLDHACKRGFPTPGRALAYFLRLHKLPRIGTRFGAYVAADVGEFDVAEVDAINGAFMLVRDETLEAIGHMDESFWMYGEDIDWCQRSWDNNWSVLYWPVETVRHLKAGVTGRPRTPRSTLWFYRAMALYLRKHPGNNSRPIVIAISALIYARMAPALVHSVAVHGWRAARRRAAK